MPIKRRKGVHFIGLDLSLTGTGIVVLNNSMNPVMTKTLKNKLRGMERLDFIRSEISEVIANFPNSKYCIENYAMGIRSGQSFSIGELGGVIKLLLYDFQINPSLVTPTQLKKFIIGKGAGDKNIVLLAVYKKWGFDAPDDNQADAYGLARLAKELYSTSGNLTKPQLEVLETIRNPPKKKGKKK
jgi:Holliday junction resolvasome RuvABC endonuclease subunit